MMAQKSLRMEVQNRPEDQWRRVARTVLQTVVAVTAVAPILVNELGMDKTAGAGALIVAVSGILARLMAMPEVNEKLGPWLRK